MRVRWFTAIVVLSLAIPALAQNRPRGNRPDGAQGGPQRGQGQRGPGAGMFDRMTGRLAGDLQLTEEQQTEYDQIVADFRQRMAALPGPTAETQDLMRQLREARQNGDQEKMRELGAKLQEQRGGAMGGVMNDFFDQVEPILDAGQKEKLATFRERAAQFMGGAQRGADMRRMIQELPDKLDLDEQQREQFDALVADMRQQADARRQEMQPLIDEMRQAQQDGDQQRVEEIRQQLAQGRGQGGMPFDALFDNLEKILNDDQKTKLADIRKTLGPRGAQSGPTDVRSVLQAIRRLDLDDDQRAGVKEITDKAMRESRKLEARDTAAQAKLATDTKQQIVKLLTPEQVQEFERVLQQASRPARQQRRPAAEPGSPPQK
jgi:hypothetical protein